MGSSRDGSLHLYGPLVSYVKNSKLRARKEPLRTIKKLRTIKNRLESVPSKLRARWGQFRSNQPRSPGVRPRRATTAVCPLVPEPAETRRKDNQAAQTRESTPVVRSARFSTPEASFFRFFFVYRLFLQVVPSVGFSTTADLLTLWEDRCDRNPTPRPAT